MIGPWCPSRRQVAGEGSGSIPSWATVYNSLAEACGGRAGQAECHPEWDPWGEGIPGCVRRTSHGKGCFNNLSRFSMSEKAALRPSCRSGKVP